MDKNEKLGSWFIRMWFTYPFRILGVNCIFLLACLPIVTIPAAYCGLNAIVQKIYRKKYIMSVSQEFFAEFKTDFIKRLVITIALIIVPLGISLILHERVSLIAWYCITAIFLVMVLILFSWFFPQLALLNLRPMEALKNSFIFMMINSTKNFFLVLIWTVCLTITLWGWPMSGFLLLVLPVVQVLIITGITMPTFNQYLIQDEDDEL